MNDLDKLNHTLGKFEEKLRARATQGASASLMTDAGMLWYRKYSGEWGLFLQPSSGEYVRLVHASIEVRLHCVSQLKQLATLLDTAQEIRKRDVARAQATMNTLLE